MSRDCRKDIFKSGQIVCLESGQSYLYGEVIQVVTQRKLCWVRPLTITTPTTGDSYTFECNLEPDIIDLRSASDLLLPLNLFRASYDTEAIFLLTALAAKEPSLDKQKMSTYLNSFVTQVWQNNQEMFN